MPELTAGGAPRLAFFYGARDVLWKGEGILPYLDDGGPVAATLSRCAQRVAARLGWSLEEMLRAGWDSIPEQRADVALAAVQLALTEGWLARGVVPDALGACSGGEFAAEHAYGALDVEQSLEAAMRWSSLLEQRRGADITLAVHAGIARVVELRRNSPAEYFIVGDATDAATLVACRRPVARQVAAYFEAQGIRRSVSGLNYGPHCQLIDGWQSAFVEPPIPAAAPRPGIAYYSAGLQAPDPGTPYPARMWRAVRAPMLVGATLRRMLEDGCSIFIEIGGRVTLEERIGARAAQLGKRAVVLPTMRPREPATGVMDETRAALAALGVRVAAAPP